MLFSDSHYGFGFSQSTANLLIVVPHQIARAFNWSGGTRAVVLDISQALDRIRHTGLLHKPKYYEISGQVFDLSFIAKTASKKIRALICSMKFLSPEVAMYLYKCTIHTCREWCYHDCAGARSCYLELLDKLQKLICRTVRPLLATSLNIWLNFEMYLF